MDHGTVPNHPPVTLSEVTLVPNNSLLLIETAAEGRQFAVKMARLMIKLT